MRRARGSENDLTTKDKIATHPAIRNNSSARRGRDKNNLAALRKRLNKENEPTLGFCCYHLEILCRNVCTAVCGLIVLGPQPLQIVS